MSSEFINNEYESNKKIKISEKSFWEKIKNKITTNKEISIFIGVLIIIFVGIIIFINFMTVSVLSDTDIKDKLIGSTININGEETYITDSNLKDVDIVSRVTKKNKTDIVDIELRIKMDNGDTVGVGTIEFNYIDSRWVYTSENIENVRIIETGINNEDFIKETIERNGIYTSDGIRYHGSSIKSITNIKYSDYNVEGEKTFTADIEVTNGDCYENCKISGKVLFNKEDKTWGINSVEVIGQGVVIREKEVDQIILKNIALEEITDGSSYELKRDDSSEFTSISKDMIKELNITNYIIRDDCTVRVEVTGNAASDKLGNINFSGVVSIGGNPGCGTIRNSKDINLWYK